MRYTKPSVVIGTVLVLAISMFAVAGALISGSSGQLIWLSSAPPSAALNALEHPTAAVAFDERQMVTLASPVAVDAIDPGTYQAFPNGTATVGAGTVVDSHLVHSDRPAGGTNRRQGTVTFAGDILGIAASTTRLATSDLALGAPGTTYAGTSTQWRGFETRENGGTQGDKITIAPDRRTLTFDVRTSVMDEMRVLTRHTNQLTTTIVDTPDPVSVGNDVQYALIVTNTGGAPVTDAHVYNTLPAEATYVTSSAPGGCSGTAPVDCSLGSIAVGASATAYVVATSPATVPPSGVITTSAIASPGANEGVSVSTTVEIPVPGESKGFVIPGDAIDTGGEEPAVLTLPDTGPGAPVLITQGPGTFCGGPCAGIATTISSFPGYDDPYEPIHLTLTYVFPDSPTSLTDAAAAFGATIYKNDDPENPDVGVPVAWCDTPGASIAIPRPCLDGRTITQPTTNSFVVTFEIVYLSGDPKFARR